MFDKIFSSKNVFLVCLELTVLLNLLVMSCLRAVTEEYSAMTITP